jgi:two-component system nitrate/nitrite response regulator NarL
LPAVCLITARFSLIFVLFLFRFIPLYTWLTPNMEAIKPIRVLTVDDQPLMNEGYRSILKDQDSIELVGTALNITDLIKMQQAIMPQVILICATLLMAAPQLIMRLIKGKQLRIKVIAVISELETINVANIFSLGVQGCIIKKNQPEIFIKAISDVYAKGYYADAVVSIALFQSFTKRTKLPTFSKRQKEIMLLLNQGFNNKDIARQLKISPKTVSAHRVVITQKTGTHTVDSLRRYIQHHGLIENISV